MADDLHIDCEGHTEHLDNDELSLPVQAIVRTYCGGMWSWYELDRDVTTGTERAYRYVGAGCRPQAVDRG